MISCNIVGGLGNQLFQIFTTIAHSVRQNSEYVFPMNKAYIYDKRGTYWDNIFNQLKTSEKLPDLKNYNEQYFRYNLIYQISDIKLCGWFQSYKYFENEYLYIFKLCKLDEKRLLCLDKYKYPYDNCISIHFRMGDYSKPQHLSYHGICTNDYYIKGIKTIVNNTKTKFDILCFSEKDDEKYVNDRIEYIRKSFPTFNFIKVSYDILDWEQLLIMSLCRHNIIANSTFSWWSAYMNDNPDKIVIYPLPWFGVIANTDTVDLFPDKWISIRDACTYEI